MVGRFFPPLVLPFRMQIKRTFVLPIFSLFFFLFFFSYRFSFYSSKDFIGGLHISVNGNEFLAIMSIEHNTRVVRSSTSHLMHENMSNWRDDAEQSRHTQTKLHTSSKLFHMGVSLWQSLCPKDGNKTFDTHNWTSMNGELVYQWNQYW